MKEIIEKATLFIKEELNKFIQQFPQTRVRYEYDVNACVHIVEVVPNDIYRFDKKYIDWENKTTNQFINLFPNQNIGFISDNALVGIDEVQFELVGIFYNEIIPNTPNTIMMPDCIQVFNSNNTNTESITHFIQNNLQREFFIAFDNSQLNNTAMTLAA